MKFALKTKSSQMAVSHVCLFVYLFFCKWLRFKVATAPPGRGCPLTTTIVSISCGILILSLSSHLYAIRGQGIRCQLRLILLLLFSLLHSDEGR